MFVGISNEISKALTSDIPVEDTMVHTFFAPTSHLELRLDRSPIVHADQSRTALLIAGGTADTRVNPAQSLQLYRALKLIDRTPVRYVRYPGEGHGNRHAAARDDFARRLIRWMEHFVRDLQTELPPWELQYGWENAGDSDAVPEPEGASQPGNG
jgi:dipeptidyl aminopeptidase/acylaminoacyl peptidase